MNSNRYLVAALLGVTALTSPAAAQEARELKVDLRAHVEHDSNVARSSKGAAAVRGLAVADTIFTPSVAIDVRAPVGRQTLFLRGSTGYDFYDKNTQLNRARVDVEAGGARQAGPCLATLSSGYTRGLTQVDDPLLITAVENVQETKAVDVALACRRDSGLGFALSASKEWADNSLAAFVQSDSETTLGSAAITYARPALGTLSVFVSRETTEYPNRLISSGYDLDSFGATYERRLGARIQGSITAAYTVLDFTELTPSGGGTQKGTTYAANLSYRVSSRFRMTANFDRSVSPSVAIGRSYDLMTGYRISGDYDIGSRLNFAAGGARIDRQAGGNFQVSPLSLTDSVTNTIFASLRYKQSERFSITLNAARETRNTNTPQFDYTSNRIGVTAGAAF